jgi:transposase
MQITTVGLDLAKHIFQVHAVDEIGKVVVRKRLRRTEVVSFFASVPPCLIGMEACATSHHWTRELIKLGHTVKLMPPAYVKAYVKRGKTMRPMRKRSARPWPVRACGSCRSSRPSSRACSCSIACGLC